MLARPYEEGGKGHYIQMTVLNNADGTGFLPGLLRVERQIIADTNAFLEAPHSAEWCPDIAGTDGGAGVEAMQNAGPRSQSHGNPQSLKAVPR